MGGGGGVRACPCGLDTLRWRARWCQVVCSACKVEMIWQLAVGWLQCTCPDRS